MATTVTAQQITVLQQQVITLFAQITVLQQRCTRLESQVQLLQYQLRAVKTG